MKLLLDFLPLALFFATFRLAGADPDAAAAFATQHFGQIVSGGVVTADQAPVLLATLVVIIATFGQVAVLKLMGRKIDLMLWVSLGLVVVMGSLTIYFHNETFIKWKLSALYWTLGLVYPISHALFGKNLLKKLIGEQVELPDSVWRKLSLAWLIFFGLMGLLNLWVAYHFETATWVNFKVFGATALMFVFILGLGVYISRYLPDEDEAAKSADSTGGKP